MSTKRLRSLIIFSLLVLLILGGGIILRNFFLGRLKDRIQSIVKFDRIHFRLLPPSLVMENVQTVSESPFFSAYQVKLRLPFASLFKGEKPLTVLLDRPVFRVDAKPQDAATQKKSTLFIGLPFVLEKALIRGGELYYRSADNIFQALGIQASLQEKGEAFSVKAAFKESSFWKGMGKKPIQGQARLWLEAKGNQIEVQRFVLSGQDIIIKARGGLSNLRNPEGSLRVTFKADMKALAESLDLPFRWKGRVEGDGNLVRAQKEFTYSTLFESNNLGLNEIELGRSTGKVEYRASQGLKITMDIENKSGGKEEVRIVSEKGTLRGEWKNFHLDPVMSYFQLPWPIHSPCRGKLVLDSRQLLVDLEFKEETLLAGGGRFPLRGNGRVMWDRGKNLRFSFPGLETSFGRMDVQGKMSVGENVDFLISGDYEDVRAAREFTSLLLRTKFNFPEIRGQGHAEARIEGRYSSPRVRLDFTLSPAGFAEFDVATANGFVEVVKGRTLGQVQFDDPLSKGEIVFLAAEKALDVEVSLVEGKTEHILPRLGLNFPLRGSASGHFQVNQRGELLRVEGAFSGQHLKFGFAELRNVRGKIIWDRGVLSFPDLAFNLYGGKINTVFSLDISNHFLEIRTTAENIDLSALSSKLTGKLSFDFQGKGSLGGEVASGQFIVQDLSFPPLQKADTDGELRLSLNDNVVGLRVQGNLRPGDNDFSVDAHLPLSGTDISIIAKGNFSNLELFLPWKGARGRIKYLAEIRGLPRSPTLEGAIDFEGPILPFPGFAQALTDYGGLVFLQTNKASLRSFKAKLGGGNLKGSGEIQFGKGRVENIRLTLEGENLLLSPLERVRLQTDTSLNLIKNQDQFQLEGNFDIKRLLWRREIFEPLRLSSSSYPQMEKQPRLFDDLTLNLRLKAEDNAWMENSLGKMRGRFDLTVLGSVKAPIILGEIEAIGGEAYFQDRKFQVLRGRISFFNPVTIEPYLNFRCETYVKDYRVTLNLTGLASQLKPEFSSSPPLPSEDVLALLALGEAFRRPYSTEASSQIGTASLLSFQLTEQAQKRAEKLFSLDRFRIDPFLMGSMAEMTARLTIGKKISRDFYIYYSTNLTRQMEEIIRLEWDLGREFSLVGTRNELGRISFDFKVRKRF